MNKLVIGNKIKYERQRFGLTLDELGRRLGVSKQCLSGWEHGRNMPDIISLHNISLIFNIDIKDFLAETKTDSTVEKNKSLIFDTITEKELLIIEKFRSMSPDKRKALEILLDIKSNTKYEADKS
ncbi:MAG: helix-turn-helix domain-containing protein [Phascolarctobacterium sp.]|nr:helix-turn-helix domain-containing protein [Phascolarctobacterium sp.]